MMMIMILTLVVFAIAMLIMSVGVLFSGRCLRGSCGGSEVLDPNGDPISCATCPRRKEREKDSVPLGSSRGDERQAGESLPVLQG